jgi:ribosomal protein S18 acetylase RimI-like enzyme
MEHDVLRNPVWHALTGPSARFAHRSGSAVRFRADVAPFAAVADPAQGHGWADLAGLVGAGEVIAVVDPPQRPPAPWTLVRRIEGLQLTHRGPVEAAPDPGLLELGAPDVREMLDLVERTRPGPFLPRTVELGGYRGIRAGGALVAMGGHRLQPPGWVELSAVCTDPAHRGTGLASRVIGALLTTVTASARRAFLHVEQSNTDAVRLYRALGFTVHRPVVIDVLTR